MLPSPTPHTEATWTPGSICTLGYFLTQTHRLFGSISFTVRSATYIYHIRIHKNLVSAVNGNGSRLAEQGCSRLHNAPPQTQHDGGGHNRRSPLLAIMEIWKAGLSHSGSPCAHMGNHHDHITGARQSGFPYGINNVMPSCGGRRNGLECGATGISNL